MRQGALKFEAISNIEFIDLENEWQEIIIQPSTRSSSRPKINTDILVIGHNLGIDKFVAKLENIENSVKDA